MKKFSVMERVSFKNNEEEVESFDLLEEANEYIRTESKAMEKLGYSVIYNHKGKTKFIAKCNAYEIDYWVRKNDLPKNKTYSVIKNKNEVVLKTSDSRKASEYCGCMNAWDKENSYRVSVSN